MIGRWAAALVALLGMTGCPAASTPAKTDLVPDAGGKLTGAELAKAFEEMAVVTVTDLMRQANHDRKVFGTHNNALDPTAKLAFPPAVKRVWIDVGAYKLEKTLPTLHQRPEVGVIAIDPLREAWLAWPDEPRLIAYPVAIDLTEGVKDFHVNAFDETSSLAKSRDDSWAGRLQQTVEVRRVFSWRLERILAAIPDALAIEMLKVDTQGRDLQVVKSAGMAIRRVKTVVVEVLLKPAYQGEGDERPGTEQEFIDYLGTHGFALVKKFNVFPNQQQEDLEFENRSGSFAQSRP
jgi:FkbM family methyltransferase